MPFADAVQQPAIVEFDSQHLTNTSSMHATVLLQTVCNVIVCRHRDFPNNMAGLLT